MQRSKQLYFRKAWKICFIFIFIIAAATILKIVFGLKESNSSRQIFFTTLANSYLYPLCFILEILLLLIPIKSHGVKLKKNWGLFYILTPVLTFILGALIVFVGGMLKVKAIVYIGNLLPVVLVVWAILVLAKFNKLFMEDYDKYLLDKRKLREIDSKEITNKYFANESFENAEEELQKDYELFLANQEEIRQQEYVELHKNDAALEYDGRSVFDGNFWSYIGWRFLGRVLTIVTLGICYPVAVNMINRWEIQHTVINGRRLSFNGTAMQLFGKWMLWWFLSIITVGFFAFFIPIRVKAWKVKHSNMFGGKEGVQSHFSGKPIPYVGLKILMALFKLFALGIFAPVAEAIMMRWETKHTTYNGYHLCFKGNGFALMGKYIIWYLLGIVTFGFFFLVIPIRLTKWKVKNSCLNALREEEVANS